MTEYEPEKPARACPRCDGELRFWLKLNPVSHGEGTHRVYRCEACDRFDWVFEPPGKRT